MMTMTARKTIPYREDECNLHASLLYRPGVEYLATAFSDQIFQTTTDSTWNKSARQRYSSNDNVRKKWHVQAARAISGGCKNPKM